ncbi:hypothetical protein L218DRAFT_170094 [Marasmius fiardii PR-910]|nr:hypothetical protein L218DRAFT_170094 [Marasmius fiardii PR-910]
MIINNQESNTNKSLPLPPLESKAEEVAKEREAEIERTMLKRGQSSRSYMEAPPPSYEAVEGRALESQVASTSDGSFTFVRPSPSHSPPFPEAQSSRLEVPIHEVPLPPSPRILAQSTSHSGLRPYLTPNHSSVSTPTLIPRSLDFFPPPSSAPLASTSSYGYSTTTLSTAAYPSTLSVNTISADTPPTDTTTVTNSSRAPSNSPPLQVPTFTPSAKKSFFSTQSGNKKRNAKEARLFVLSQLTHLLQNQTTPQYNVEAHKTILKSCADACSTNKVYLPAIMQEKCVEEHTPFYWSIVQRPSSTSLKMPDLLQALLVFGSPLTEDTRMDVGRACLMVNDPKLYQALRVNKYYMALGTAEGTLSPEPVFKDRVMIEDKGGGAGGGNGEFAATLEIPRYKERATIQIEFIAQRRLWRLTIRKTSNPRKWKIGIGLLEQSPATYVDSRFILQSLNTPLVPAPSRINSHPLHPVGPPSPTRTYSDSSDTASVSTGTGSSSGSSSSGTIVSPPSYGYGYGVRSAFVTAAYSGYPPEKMEMAYQRQQHSQPRRPTSMASARTDSGSGSSVNALSFYPDVVKGTTVASLRNRQESFPSVSNDGTRRASMAVSRESSWSVDDENVGGSGNAVNGGGSELSEDGEDDFSVSVEDLPPLPGASVLKEVRLKSNSMISAGKKEIESEIEINFDLTEDGGGKTMRARFEARLAKPESECVIC